MNENETSLFSNYIFSDRKRALDVTVGSMLAGIALPVEMAALWALRSRLDDGPAYLRQKRLGTTLIKLRTMLQAPDGKDIVSIWDGTEVGNSRIPQGIPAKIRRWRLDELPQLRQAVIGGLQGGVPRMSLVGIRPMLDLHNDEVYQAAHKTIPEIADRWYYRWLQEAPRGMISPSALHQAPRASNVELNAVDWVRREDAYCRTATEYTDLALIGQTMFTIGSSVMTAMLQKALAPPAA